MARITQSLRTLALGLLGLLWSAPALGQSGGARPANTPRAVALGTAQRTALDLCTGFIYEVPTEPREGYAWRDRGEQRQGAMLREVRRLHLGPGRHQVTWRDLPESAVVETVVVRLEEGAPAGVRLLSHRATETAYSPAAFQALLLQNGSVTSEVVTTPGGPSATRKVFGGGLVSLSEGMVLRVDNELTVLPRSHVDASFALPQRELVLDLEVPSSIGAAVDIGLEVTLLLDRVLQHPPFYTFRFDREHGRGTLAGSALITNLSGYALGGATASWCSQAGDRNQVPIPGRFETSPSSSTTQTGLVSMRGLPPFRFPSPLRFGPTEVATAELLPTVVAPTEEARRTVIQAYELLTRETERDAVHTWATQRIFTLPVPGVASGTTLPWGRVSVWLDPQAPTPLGRGALEHVKDQGVTISAEDPMVRALGQQLTYVRRGKCREKATWRLEVPLDLAALGPLGIAVPERPENLRLSVRNLSNATIDVAKDQPMLTVLVDPSAVARRRTDPIPRVTFDLSVERLRCP